MLDFIFYSFINGILYFLDLLNNPLLILWFIGAGAFFVIYLEEAKEIDELYVDDDRDLL